jgi:hypothetical protein
MTGDGLDELRRNLARHREGDAARARPLIQLGQALADKYWRVGPGLPAARRYLDEGIDVFKEAYGYLEENTFLRGQVAGQLGWLLGTRHGVDFSAEADREQAIRLLEEALAFPQLPRMAQMVSRLTLGQMLLSRSLHNLRSSEFLLRLVSSGLSGEEMTNADRAAECFRAVIEEPATSSEIVAMAQTLLDLAQAVRTLTKGAGGGLGRVDLGGIMQGLSSLQTMQQQGLGRPMGGGFAYMPNPFQFEADDLATPPLERPVIVVEGMTPAAAAHPLRQQASPPVSAATYRMAMLDKLQCAGLAGVIAFLDERAVLPAVEIVDDVVALGSLLVEAPDAVGTDRVLFAVALFLRAIGQGDGGWGADDGGADDAQVAADSLLTVGDALLNEPADAVVLAFRLAARLDTHRPALDAQARLAEWFATVTEALGKVRADGLLYSVGEYRLLLSAASGRCAVVAPGSRLPTRLLVVAEDPLPNPTVASYVSSAAQLVELAKRTRRPLGEQAVFVANPRGDRQQATVDALMLRRTFYPASTGLGETVENTHGAGTAAELRKNLGASLLHLGCAITPDGGVELAGSDVFAAAEIAGGDPPAACGLAVLAPTAKPPTALIDALLASRFVGVIAFRNEVPDRLASLMYFLLHRQLVDERLDPAAAVAEVRRWMADPDRQPAPDLPGLYDGAATASELADPAHWGALIHHGVSRPRRPTGVSRDRPRPA